MPSTWEVFRIPTPTTISGTWVDGVYYYGCAGCKQYYPLEYYDIHIKDYPDHEIVGMQSFRNSLENKAKPWNDKRFAQRSLKMRLQLSGELTGELGES